MDVSEINKDAGGKGKARTRKGSGLVALGATAFLAALISGSLPVVNGATEIKGNWYGDAVKGVKYTNVGTAGTYDQVVNMAPDGVCTSQPKPFSGPISPLDEEVSLHFRGPCDLKQVAVYMPHSADKLKREVHNRGLGHGHGHAHHHLRQKLKREAIHDNVGAAAATPVSPNNEMVHATIDGKVVSWVNDYLPGQIATPPAQPVPVAQANEVEAKAPEIAADAPPANVAKPDGQNQPDAPKDAPVEAAPAQAGDYERVAYYNSATQEVDNLSFLANLGGQSSGVFDYNYGSSLAYVDSTGTACAASNKILSDTTIPSNKEIVIMSGQSCDDGGCGYFRPGSVAYHGFGGAEKVFVFEFSMPMDGQHSTFNGDMPAIWMLNAQIPRTLQYGKAECSCWASGCGEFDIVEALHQGSTFLKSTLHTNTPGGDSNYFDRPSTGTMKLAVVFNANSTILVQALGNDFNLGPTLHVADVEEAFDGEQAGPVSHFPVTS